MERNVEKNDATTESDINKDTGDKTDSNLARSLLDEIADIDSDSLDELEDSEDTDDNQEKDSEESTNETQEDETDETIKRSKDETLSSSENTKTEQESDQKPEKSDKKQSEDSQIDKSSVEDVSQVDKLLAEINRLNGLVKTSDNQQTVKSSKIEADIHNYLKDLDMDDVSSDPVVFNKILHAVADRVQRQTTEQVLLNIPQVVLSQVQNQSYFKRMADNFYTDNPDLVNVKQVVKACTQQIQMKNPEWKLEEVLKETAKRTRETLGMVDQIKQSSTSGNVPSLHAAAFGHSRSSSAANLKQQKSALQRELDEI